LTKCDPIGGPGLPGLVKLRRMRRLLRMTACALAVTLAASGPASAYIDPGTGSMLLQVFAAGVAGAIFYFRELRNKITSLFRRKAPAAEDTSEPSSGDPR